MLSILMFTAALACTLFAGAALYINLVEHPARMARDTATAAQVWALSYRRAVPVQASLAIIGFAAGVGAWLMGAGLAWLAGAVLLGAVVPFTFIGVMPTNDRLLAPGRDLASPETRALLQRWGRLHAVRSISSAAAAVVFIGLLVGAR